MNVESRKTQVFHLNQVVSAVRRYSDQRDPQQKDEAGSTHVPNDSFHNLSLNLQTYCMVK